MRNLSIFCHFMKPIRKPAPAQRVQRWALVAENDI